MEGVNLKALCYNQKNFNIQRTLKLSPIEISVKQKRSKAHIGLHKIIPKWLNINSRKMQWDTQLSIS